MIKWRVKWERIEGRSKADEHEMRWKERGLSW